MYLIYLILGIIILVLLLNSLFIYDEKVDTFSYNEREYDEDDGGDVLSKNKNKVLKNDAIAAAKEKYKGRRYTFKDESIGYYRVGNIEVYKKKLALGWEDTCRQEWVHIVVFTLLVIFVFSVAMMAIKRAAFESHYLQYQNEYEIITAQLERVESGQQQNYIINGEVGSLEDVYDKIETYNNWVIRNRYWSNNDWLSFWYNHYANDLELIELERAEE